MDFCSVKVGITDKAKQMARKDRIFTVSTSDVIVPNAIFDIKFAKGLMDEINEAFGGDVITFKRGVYKIDAPINVVNAYLLSTKKELVNEAGRIAQEVLPDWMLTAYNTDPEQALLEIAQQLKTSGNAMFDKELARIASEIFPDTYLGDVISNYRFNTVPKLSMDAPNSDISFYNLRDMHDFNTLQDVVLHRMANNTSNPSSRNIISKLNNKYYITSTDKMGENDINRNIARFNNYLHFNRIPSNIFDLETFTTKNGNVGVKIRKKNIAHDDVIPETAKTDRIASIIDFLSERFGYKNQVESISRAAFKAKFPDKYKEGMNAAVVGDKIYLLTSSNSNDITTEELLHPFVNALATANPSLFSSLLSQAKKEFPLLVQVTEVLYENQPRHIQNQEIVAKALARVFNREQEENEPKSLKETIKDFTRWLINMFKELFNYYNNSKYTNVHLDALNPELTLRELAHLINTTDSRFDVAFGPTFYNQSIPSSIYDDIYKSLTDPVLSASIGNVVANLPKAIKELNKNLSDVTNTKDKKDLASVLKAIREVQNNEDKIKEEFRAIVTVVNLLNTIEDRIAVIDNSAADANFKLLEYNGIYKTIKSLDYFKELMSDLYNSVSAIKNKPPELKLFYDMLRDAIAVPINIENKLTGLFKNPIIDVLSEYNAPLYQDTLNRIKESIEKQENRRDNPSISLADRTRASKKIEDLKKDIEKLPTKETFKKIFDGQFNDANSISLMLESGIVNGHPLVSSLMSIIEDIYYKANQDLLRSRTGFQKHIDELVKAIGGSLRNPEKLYERITTFVKIPTSVVEKDGVPDLDDAGNPKFQYVQQRALLSNYDFEYLQIKKELEMYAEYLYGKFVEFRNSGDLTNADKYLVMYKEAATKNREFNKENSERKFKDPIYEMYELLNKPLGVDENGNEITVGKLRNSIYRRRDEAERDLRKNFDDASRIQAMDEIALLDSEIRQLKNPYDLDSKLKEGIPMKIVETIQEYDRLHQEYGTYVVTKEGEAEFDRDMLILNEQFAKGVISEDEYNRRKSLMTKDEILPQYFQALKGIHDEIDEVMKEIIGVPGDPNYPGIPEFAEHFNKADKDAIKDGYTKIRDQVKPYRDKNGIIDGNLISQAAPNVVVEIKLIQEAVERIKESTSKLTSLSVNESLELKKLDREMLTLSKSDPTYIAKFDRISELRVKLRKLQSAKAVHKELINTLNTLLEQLGHITEGDNTIYYDEAKTRQTELLESDAAVLELVEDYMSDPDGVEIPQLNIQYRKNNRGEWSKVFVNPVSLKREEVRMDENGTGYEMVRNILLNMEAKRALEKSQWWKDNHFTKLVFSKSDKGYKEIEEPIYIWKKTSPRNPNYTIKDQPASMYSSWKANPEYVNENYKLINGLISAPKANKFVSAEYKHLSESKDDKDKAYHKFLEYSRKVYHDAQTRYDEYKRLGDVLPAVVKTQGENLVNATNSFIDRQLASAVSANLAVNTQLTDNDTSYLTGGSMSKAERIPTRFVSDMDKDIQSANIPSMILVFELAAAQYRGLKDQLPLIETIQNLAGKVAVTQSRMMATKVNFMQGMKNLISKDGKSIQTPKDTTKSNLSKTIDGFIDMFVYGRTTKQSTINVNGAVVDLNKLAGSLMGFAAKSVFIGNIFAAAKNTISTRIQIMIQANVNQNVYSQANFNKANGQAVKYVRDLLSDYTKVGDKSLIGQVLDYFSVLPDNINGQFTSKTEFTIAKEKMTLLASPKAFSEFEVMLVQFLTFANNEMIEVNGRKISLGNIEEIFEKGVDGVVKFKDGVKFPKKQELAFVKIFRKYTREIAGAYRQTEQTQLETAWAGKLVMYMKKYLAPGISNRYAGRRYSIEEGDITEGYYNSTFKTLVSLFKDYSGDVMAKWNDMEDMEKAHFIKFCREFVFIMTLVGVTSLMGGGDDKKELKANSYAYNFLLAELIAAKTETETFAFATFSGIDDLIRIIRNPITASQQIANVYKVFPLLAQTLYGSEDAYFKQNSGLHHKGDSKLLSQFLKVIGYTGRTWDGPELVKQQQLIQTLR